MMYWIIPLILLFFIIYISIWYQDKVQTTRQYEQFSQAPKVDPAIAGYMFNKNVDVFSLLLSEILMLVQKGYIKLEVKEDEKNKRDYIFTKIKDDINELKEYELIAYNSIFEKGIYEVSLKEYEKRVLSEETLSNHITVKAITLEKAIQRQMLKDGLIHYIQEEEKIKLSIGIRIRKYVILTILLMLLAYFLQEYFLFAIVMILGIYMINRVHKKTKIYTNKGREQKNQVYGYARFLKEDIYFKKRNISHIILWEDIYVYAICYHIPLVGIKEFITDEIKYRSKMNMMRDAIYVGVICMFTLFYISFTSGNGEQVTTQESILNLILTFGTIAAIGASSNKKIY